jgi:hypothetical protein
LGTDDYGGDATVEDLAPILAGNLFPKLTYLGSILTHDLLSIVLDPLRYDVAEECLLAGRTPNLARLLPGGMWERRHTPESFTYAAHQAFTVDSRETQAAALAYIDRHLPPLFQVMQHRSPTNCIICSDRGTADGEDDYVGHRLSHPVVWTVPYAEFVLA